MASRAKINKQQNITSPTTVVSNEKISIVIIESNGVCRTLTPKDISFDTLYKKGGFVNNENFSKIHTWNGLDISGVVYNSVSIWGKLVGKSNNINKYILPTPLNNHTLFGACIIVHSSDDNKILSIDSNQWNNIYTVLLSTAIISNDVITAVNSTNQPPAKISKPTKRKVSNVNTNAVVDSATNTLSKLTLRTHIKPPVKRNKKQDTDDPSGNTLIPSIHELNVEKYVFTDEE